MKDKTNMTNEAEATMASGTQVNEDFKHALLIVSLLANAFVLIGWVALQVTSQYDYQVSLFLFYR
jgi:hypothetical protein